MECFCLQDWVTIQGGVQPIIQGENSWLDLFGYQDVVGWLEVREYSNGNTSVNYQTSPTKDESLFTNLASVPLVSVGVTVTPMIKVAMPRAAPTLARWLRWNVHVTSGTWNVTFRIWLAANRTGASQ